MLNFCGNSSVVEHHVANVRVASSNLVSRSIKFCYKFTFNYCQDIINTTLRFNMDGQNISWTAGEVVYKVGDEPDFAYLLTKGEVEILSKKGTRVGFINEEEVFGELSILLNTKRTVTTIALKESQALLIPKENLLNDYNKTSFFIKAILRTTYMRLTNLNSTIKMDLKSLNK